MSKDKKVPPIEIDKDKLVSSKSPSLQDLLKQYLSKLKPEDYPLYAVIGIAGPVNNNEVLSITNIPHWPKFNGKELAEQFKIKKFVLEKLKLLLIIYVLVYQKNLLNIWIIVKIYLLKKNLIMNI